MFFVAGLKAKSWSGRPTCGATSSHVSVLKCSLGAERHVFASTFSLLDSDLTNCCRERVTLSPLALLVWFMSCFYWLCRFARGVKSFWENSCMNWCVAPSLDGSVDGSGSNAIGGAGLARSRKRREWSGGWRKHDWRGGEGAPTDSGTTWLSSGARQCG